ncbi:MAG: DUF4091 domain-containing protein [Candidatus Glassbacteria bacterium]|nr:DUF4091 domain-containing protein [Candidatus Glassbacteria bacterium]
MRPVLLLVTVMLLPLTLAAETVRLEVTADAMVTSERGRYGDNWGASVSVPVRQNQNWSGFETKAVLMRFDGRPLEGMTPRAAWLNIFLAKGELFGVGLSSVLARWEEGRGLNGQTGRGGASWRWASEPADEGKTDPPNYWAWPGSGVYSVTWAHPDLIYSHAGPAELEKKTLPDGTLHIRLPVSPELVAAMAAGISDGLILTDDKGQVAEGLSLKGLGTPYRYNLAEDLYLFTREIQDPDLRPFLEVETVAGDTKKPGVIGRIKVDKIDPFSRLVSLSFTAPADDGVSGGAVLGYESRVSTADNGWDSAAPLPLWEMPRPVDSGAIQAVQLASLRPGTWYVYIRALDEAGNRGEPGVVKVEMPDKPATELTAPSKEPAEIVTSEVSFGNVLRLWACPDLTKVDPVGGGVLTDDANYRPPGGERFSNLVWDAGKRTVSLRAARGEVVAFQLILERLGRSKLSRVRVALDDLTGDAGQIAADPNFEAFRLWYMDVQPRPAELTGPWELVEEKDHRAAWHADACLPLIEPFQEWFDLPSMDNMGDSQRNQAVWVDMFIPPGTRPGTYRGTVTVTAEELDSPAGLEIELEVLPLELPQKVSWTLELNGYSYGLQSLFGDEIGDDRERFLRIERRTYQLARKHRSTLNILPYGQSGNVPRGSAPELEGEGSEVEVASWAEWDSRYGDLLTGRAFTPELGYHGPGEGVPLEHIYLAFHENWPLPVEKYYGDFADIQTREQFTEWAKSSRALEEAFSKEYRQGITSLSRSFFEHFKSMGYTGTNFQFYFNNKYYFKSNFFGMRNEGRGSSFWLLDEPVDYDDYAANRFYISLVRDGWLQADTSAVKAHFRTDVSQPEMTRGMWDGLCNIWNSSGLREYGATAAYRMARIPGELYWHYGGGPPVAGRLGDFQSSFFTYWSIGSAGDLPYWDSLRGEGWFQPSDLAVFYPGTDYARSGKDYDGPLAGMRLKGIRRAQQDVEYLMLLSAKDGWSRSKVTEALAGWSDDPDAIIRTFEGMSAEKIFGLRAAVAEALLAD